MIDVVCGVIGNDAGEILACQRPVGKHLAGFWELPGGKVDPGEMPAAALVRELREELTVEVAVGEALAPVEWVYEDRAIRLLSFRCAILRGVPVAVEHAAIRWCREDELATLRWAEADVPVLASIFPAFSRIKR